MIRKDLFSLSPVTIWARQGKTTSWKPFTVKSRLHTTTFTFFCKYVFSLQTSPAKLFRNYKILNNVELMMLSCRKRAQHPVLYVVAALH